MFFLGCLKSGGFSGGQMQITHIFSGAKLINGDYYSLNSFTFFISILCKPKSLVIQKFKWIGSIQPILERIIWKPWLTYVCIILVWDVRQSIGYKTVAIRSNRLKLGDHNVEAFHDTHTQNQVNLWNIDVFFRLLNVGGSSFRWDQMQITLSFSRSKTIIIYWTHLFSLCSYCQSPKA